MLTLILILIAIASVFLTLVVLIQNPKGGIAANFIAPNQVMGVKRTTDVVEKATWVLAIVLISLSLLSNFFIPVSSSDSSNDSRLKDQMENVSVPAMPQQQAPAAGQEQPAEQPQEQPAQ